MRDKRFFEKVTTLVHKAQNQQAREFQCALIKGADRSTRIRLAAIAVALDACRVALEYGDTEMLELWAGD